MAVRTVLIKAAWCLAALCCVGVLTACLSTKVRSWRADQFGALQAEWLNYRWEGPALLVSAAPGDGIAAVDTAVRAHVDRRLLALGYRENPARASFEVAYRLGNQAVVGLPGTILSSRELHERVLAGPNAEYEVSSKFYTHRTLGYHEVSHLRVSVYDLGMQRIVWESAASRLIDDPQASAETVTGIVGRMVQKMFRGFPAARH